MKRIFLFITTICLAMTASAQYQVANSDFEGEWVNCYPWEKGAKVTDAYGIQPTGWCVSNVPNSLMPLVASKVTGFSGSKGAIKLQNVSVMGQNAPGYITLGTTWATAETKMTDVRNPDGGVFGGISFTSHPDGIQLQYQRDMDNGDEKITLLAYLWKGTWKQADVPSNTAVGVFSYGTATKADIEDRDINILETDESIMKKVAAGETRLGGTITHTEDAELIAVLEDYKTGTVSDWTTWTAEFNYKSDSDPAKINIVISTTDFFGGRSAVKSGNTLTIDDIKLLYYSELASATYDGDAITFSGTAATIDEYYDESKLEITSNGHGATVETNMDEANQLLTITIKGENISEDASNYHTYTIQFKTQPQYQRGDVNKDGEVSIADVTALVNIILGKAEENELADVNEDGEVSIADVTALVNIILGKN